MATSMSPDLATIRANIATVIRTVMNPNKPSAVTTVHTRRRFWKTPEEFKKILERPAGDALPGKINAWFVYRGGTRPVEVRGGQTFLFYSLHRIDCMGYMGVQDDGKTFSSDLLEIQVEAIREAFRASKTIFGNMEKTLPDSTVEFSAEPYERFEFTCWAARISVEVEGIEVKSLV